jgi:hypothetical protein
MHAIAEGRVPHPACRSTTPPDRYMQYIARILFAMHVKKEGRILMTSSSPGMQIRHAARCPVAVVRRRHVHEVQRRRGRAERHEQRHAASGGHCRGRRRRRMRGEGGGVRGAGGQVARPLAVVVYSPSRPSRHSPSHAPHARHSGKTPSALQPHAGAHVASARLGAVPGTHPRAGRSRWWLAAGSWRARCAAPAGRRTRRRLRQARPAAAGRLESGQGGSRRAVSQGRAHVHPRDQSTRARRGGRGFEGPASCASCPINDFKSVSSKQC